jgi:TonB-linked SusC/RagA family outer membrane protein
MQRSTTTDRQQLPLSQGLLNKPHRWQHYSLTTLLLLLVFSLPGRAGELPQDITLSFREATLDKVFKEIRKQTGYSFVYTESELQRANKVTIEVANSSLDNVLGICFRNQPLTYTIVEKIVIVKSRAEKMTVIPVVNKIPAPDKKITMRGKVMNEKGDALAGATVTVRKTDLSTTTDEAGIFQLSEIEEDAVLVVSSVGHVTQQVKVKALNMEIKLPIAVKEEEEVVVAYNKISSRSNTGAVTVVKGSQIATLPNRSFDKSLQGLVPGLLVTSGSGQPGSPPSNFMLRGIATGGEPVNGETFRNPLIIIDGIPVTQEPAAATTSNVLRITNPLAQLNTSDIESVSVLKDASAVALYGAKASNGVILVTTKRGKAGKTTLSVRHQTDIASVLDGKIKMLNQQEYLELLYEAYRNSDPSIWTDAKILEDLKSKFPTKPDGSFYSPSDWTGAYFHKSALTMTNEVSLSGGNTNSNFYLNLQYTKQNGAAINTGFDQKSFRFNYENRPTSWIKLGLNSMFSYNTQKYSNEGYNNFLTTLAISPLNPIRDFDGNYIYQYSWGQGGMLGTIRPNPLAQAQLNINTSNAYRSMSKISGEIKLTKDISFNTALGVDFMLNEVKQKEHPLVSTGTGFITEQPYRSIGIINTNILQYNKQFHKKHNLTILLGQEVQLRNDKFSSITRTNLTDNPGQDELASGTIESALGNTSKQRQLSYFSQANYGYREKYYLSGSIRTDGSSQFGPNNRFGTYWSIGGAWVVSAESFMEKANSWINFLKFRGSMGPAGNSAAIADRLRFDKLEIRSFQNGIAVYSVAAGNPSIKWEETFVWNAGADIRLLNDRITLTADIYTRKTKNLIAYNIKSPLGTGYSTLTGNVGDIRNSGIELSLSASIIREKDLFWNITANWSRNRNKLTKSNLPQSPVAGTDGNLINKEGYEYNSFYLPYWGGVNSANGRPMWIDSTGKPNEDYLAAKPDIVGKAQPDGFGSLNTSFGYKGFELAATIYYQYGGQIYFTSNLQNDGNDLITDPYVNQSKSALNRWQKPGDIAPNPRRLLSGVANTPAGSEYDFGSYYSTRFLYDGDFIRLGNIFFSYSFPQKLIRSLHLNTARIYVQGHNLATWTKYSGQDPENVGSSGFGNVIYPQQRSYSIGVNLTF